MYYVYVLKSLKDSKHYIGQTSDIEMRLRRHNAGYVKSTKYRRPLKVIYREKFITREEALTREKELKKFKGGLKFKNLIN